jgi:hypothetical protein
MIWPACILCLQAKVRNEAVSLVRTVHDEGWTSATSGSARRDGFRHHGAPTNVTCRRRSRPQWILSGIP